MCVTSTTKGPVTAVFGSSNVAAVAEIIIIVGAGQEASVEGVHRGRRH